MRHFLSAMSTTFQISSWIQRTTIPSSSRPRYITNEYEAAISLPPLSLFLSLFISVSVSVVKLSGSCNLLQPMIFDREFERLQNNQRQVLVYWKFVWKNNSITSLINELSSLRCIIKYLTCNKQRASYQQYFLVHFPKYDSEKIITLEI